MLREGSKEMDTDRLGDLAPGGQRRSLNCDSFLDPRIEVFVDGLKRSVIH
jgi:hypothetical protein